MEIFTSSQIIGRPVFLIFFILSINLMAQDIEEEHLLDGTSLEYHYQNGTAVKANFLNGKFQFKWIKGPRKGREGSENYRSRKIGDKMYLVSFIVKESGSFVSLVFNFNQSVMYSASLINPGKEYQSHGFNGGIIKYLQLVEANP